MIQWINETKSSFFERINKIDKPLAKLKEKRRCKTIISDIKEVIWKQTPVKFRSYRNLMKTCILENDEGTDKFLDTYDSPKWAKRPLKY
jgi:hypothetical protein